jgi:hypothetical protein
MRKIAVLILLFVAFLYLNPVSAANKNAKTLFNNSLNATAAETGHTGAGAPFTGMTASQIVGFVINIVLSLLGVAFLILMIYAGIIWMNARGEEKEVEKAKDIIRNSIIGLVIVLGAYAITAFVGNI